MTQIEAAEVGLYAKEVFRFVTDGLATGVAEEMVALPDELDESGNVVRCAVEIGKSVLRLMAAENPDQEGRLSLTMVRKGVNAELRKMGIKPRDYEAERRKEEKREEAETAEWWQRADEWADGLSDEQVAEFTASALEALNEDAQRIYVEAGKTVKNSRTLRGLAFELNGSVS